MTDPESRVISYTYDDLGRKTKTTYPDTSTEQTLYGTGTSAGRVIKTKDRVDVVTSYAYDSAGRLEKTTVGAAIDADILDGNPDDTTITNVNLQQITEYTYLDGSKTYRHRPRCN
jgi:YD repeat-containing protein